MKEEKNLLKMDVETVEKPFQTQYENLIYSLRHAYDKTLLENLDHCFKGL